MVWPEGALCCACGRITDGDGLCPACRESLRYDGAFLAWDETEPESTDPVESLEPITEPQDVYGPPEWFDMTEPEDPTETTMETLYGPPIAYDEQ